MASRPPRSVPTRGNQEAPFDESFQGEAWHCADLVPDDHRGNELLPNPFRRPLRLATPSEEAWTPWPTSLWPGDGWDEDEWISLAEELERSRGFAAFPAAA